MGEGALAREELTEQERFLLLSLLREVKSTTVYDFVADVLGDDFLLFLDVFASDSIRVPQREETLKLIDYVRVYIFYKSVESKPEAYRITAKKFKRRTQSVIRIINKVETLLEKGDARIG